MDYLSTELYWVSDEIFFTDLETPLESNTSRPDLRYKLLKERAKQWLKHQRAHTNKEELDEEGKRWLDGLMSRVPQLNKRDSLLFIQELANHLKGYERRWITKHPQFEEWVKYHHIDGLAALKVEGQGLFDLYSSCESKSAKALLARTVRFQNKEARASV